MPNHFDFFPFWSFPFPFDGIHFETLITYLAINRRYRGWVVAIWRPNDPVSGRVWIPYQRLWCVYDKLEPDDPRFSCALDPIQALTQALRYRLWHRSSDTRSDTGAQIHAAAQDALVVAAAPARWPAAQPLGTMGAMWRWERLWHGNGWTLFLSNGVWFPPKVFGPLSNG